jgi:hypothetical protein
MRQGNTALEWVLLPSGWLLAAFGGRTRAAPVPANLALWCTDQCPSRPGLPGCAGRPGRRACHRPDDPFRESASESSTTLREPLRLPNEIGFLRVFHTTARSNRSRDIAGPAQADRANAKDPQSICTAPPTAANGSARDHEITMGKVVHVRVSLLRSEFRQRGASKNALCNNVPFSRWPAGGPSDCDIQAG